MIGRLGVFGDADQQPARIGGAIAGDLASIVTAAVGGLHQRPQRHARLVGLEGAGRRHHDRRQLGEDRLVARQRVAAQRQPGKFCAATGRPLTLRSVCNA